MKKNLSVSLRALIITSLISLATGSLIVLSVFLIGSIRISGGDYIGAVVGGIGSIVGSFIGAVVAYIVAAYQVHKTFELDRLKGQSGNYAVIRLIKVEVDKNFRLLENSRDHYYLGKKDFIKYLSDSNWNKCSTLIGQEIKDEVIHTLSSVYSKILLLKNNDITLEGPLYDKLTTQLNECSQKLDSQLEILRN
ncbi:hypothetical protein [Paenibacillus ottowii]|uniref:Uncharacterized protein n=1 Tax=Paenibacillus ottowii TaxID=2315729 RepID=A0ABY3B7I8_9BACL|nr:hypothetical protein [Paenibacillus ottowii]TQS00036.1 hypothetical protein FKV70_04435 [Paenibacillus ottowii]TQS00105.1 hypothetical protein FKV70_04810 [Paenibacillus ottowii]